MDILRKTVTAARKAKAKAKNQSSEEKAIRLEMERMKAIEDEIHRAGIMRHNLETSLKQVCFSNPVSKFEHLRTDKMLFEHTGLIE